MAAKGRGSAVRAPPPSTSRGKKVTGRAAPIAAEKKAAPAKVSKLELDIEPCNTLNRESRETASMNVALFSYSEDSTKERPQVGGPGCRPSTAAGTTGVASEESGAGKAKEEGGAPEKGGHRGDRDC